MLLRKNINNVNNEDKFNYSLKNSSSSSSSTDVYELSGADAFYYEVSSIQAFDTGNVLGTIYAENWNSQTRDNSLKSQSLTFASNQGSKLTVKYTDSNPDDYIGTETETFTLTASNKDTYKYSISSTVAYSESGGISSSSGTYKESWALTTGRSTKNDKTDDATLTKTYSYKFSSKYNFDTDESSHHDTLSLTTKYSDGNGYKYSFVITQKDLVATISDFSYSDADKNNFKFTGSAVLNDAGDTYSINVKSLSITLDGATTTAKNIVISDISGYDIFNYFPESVDGEIDLLADFNKPSFTEDGDYITEDTGTIADFVGVIASNWLNAIG